MSANPGRWRHPSAPAFSNAHEIARDISQYGILTGVKVHKLVKMYGVLLETRVKANASGRPGPRAITGDYRRSIHAVFELSGNVASARVQTNAPQGRRLEYGFVGPDRLGRVYNQPPFPHFAPAVVKTQPEFLAAVEKALE